MGIVKQELATVLSALQLLKEDNPSRKIAEIQGKLATVHDRDSFKRLSILGAGHQQAPLPAFTQAFHGGGRDAEQGS